RPAKGGVRTKSFSDGFAFEISIEIDSPLDRVWESWHAATSRRLWLHVAGVSTRKVNAKSSLRLLWNDGSEVKATFSSRAKGRTGVDVRHDRLKSAADQAAIRTLWETSLRRLKTRLERRRG
ncbi:MAG TPA: hypothetical protein VF720_03160, partial [Candidatus Eisenbacteria bacterium]